MNRETEEIIIYQPLKQIIKKKHYLVKIFLINYRKSIYKFKFIWYNVIVDI